LSVPEVIVLGLSCGALLSIPIIIAFEPGNLRALAIVLGLFVLFPLLDAAKRQLPRKLLLIKSGTPFAPEAALASKINVLVKYRWLTVVGLVCLVIALAPSSARRPVAPRAAVVVLPLPPNGSPTASGSNTNRFLSRSQPPAASALAAGD